MRWWILAAAVLVLLYLARSVLPPFIVAALLAYILSPIVTTVQQRARLPRPLAAISLFVGLLALFGFGVWLVESQLAREVRGLSEQGPDLVDAPFVRLLGSEAFTVMGLDTDAHALAAWANDRLIEIAGRPTDAFQVAERAVDT